MNANDRNSARYKIARHSERERVLAHNRRAGWLQTILAALAAGAVGMGLIALGGCTSAQAQTAEQRAHQAFTVAQAAVVAYEAHEVQIDQVLTKVAATLPAEGPAHNAAVAGLALSAQVEANPAALEALKLTLAAGSDATLQAPK